MEAGRKGAAARKAKQERILAELREAKASIVVPEAPPTVPTADKQQQRPREIAGIVHTDWAPMFLLGGLSLVGALWYIASRSKTKTVTVPVGTTVPPSVNQLKSGTDPFIMQ